MTCNVNNKSDIFENYFFKYETYEQESKYCSALLIQMVLCFYDWWKGILFPGLCNLTQIKLFTLIPDDNIFSMRIHRRRYTRAYWLFIKNSPLQEGLIQICFKTII